ncbi:MAG: Asp-tRNA(Asn)/Glu-tRNA(Gln) amidotransferase subunit GatA [Burkholderiales bacterium]|nr:MAG: Asp-tRNA(Asn)/Glu-tRNA(Gln) amidotransferase subunit GatA [Burkholderiales bacterium]TAG83221.1 MAG: Asp-tRNA(Asn)/Glu-tRNA(Gln) amidotransferase subunit GatA [Betaproteobacteria bacterium]
MSWNAFATVAETKAALEAKEVSAVDLAKHYLDRTAQLNPGLNAYITLNPEKTLSEALSTDNKRSKGEVAPLLGVPIAHKDIYLIDGWRTTCGSKMLENFVAPYTSTVVKYMADAGMVTLGKLNMDEFAMGSSNETSFFGPVKNPWDTSRVPGGSSGGSAAAVAAGLAPASTGTDTGGSIRQPAMFCNLTGLKPTYGICSRYGIIAFASSLDQAGPFAQTAEDCALLLNAMAGFDPRDATSLDRPKEDYTRDLAKPLKGLRIGLPKEFFGEGNEPGVLKAVEAALDVYRKLGATTVEISLPNVKYSVPAYYVVAPAEASSNLSRFDGARFGHRAKDYDDIVDMYKRSRAEGFGAEVKRRILIGTYVLSHGYYDAYYLQAGKLRRLIAEDFKKAYEVCDVVIGPTAPEPAFQFGAKADDPVKMYLNDIYTICANLTGQPAMSHPCGVDENGLHVGMQIIGNYLDEARMLNVAHQYQLATDWHKKHPNI